MQFPCRHGRESISFEYNRNWLKHPKRFSLDPALKLLEGTFHASADKPLFGASTVSLLKRVANFIRNLIKIFDVKNVN